jgi:hypothetical protein
MTCGVSAQSGPVALVSAAKDGSCKSYTPFDA